ncbi:MAG: Septum formation initiator [Clostridiales bacterium]|nr:Septum formation initiator [Clostridiales bacterium]
MGLNERYVEGNTVRKIPSHYNNEENMFLRNRQVTQAKKKRLRKEKAEVLKYYLIVTFVFIGLIVLCVRYLTLFSSYSGYKNEVLAKEQYLQEIIGENTELGSRLCAPLDLLEIKRIATQDYGMVEASKEQVAFYEDSNESYVKQYADVPEDEKTAINVVGFITFGR